MKIMLTKIGDTWKIFTASQRLEHFICVDGAERVLNVKSDDYNHGDQIELSVSKIKRNKSQIMVSISYSNSVFGNCRVSSKYCHYIGVLHDSLADMIAR